MRLLKKISPLFNTCLFKQHSLSKTICTSNVLNTFWERDDKGGYKDNREKPSYKKLITDGFKELKEEVALWKQEVKEHFEGDPIWVYRPGETDVVWKFNPDTIKNFKVTTDSDNNEGYSKASLQISENGHGLFTGELYTRVPKDGKMKRSGYCNLTSLRPRKSFKREAYLNWDFYNMLVMKIRGDGRSYLINIATRGYFDVLWNDVYHYALYTRGGPYWQVIRIPFSKFFLSSKGRVQDKQYPIPLRKITTFGLTLADKIDAPFRLEIDYIGLENDPNHREDFAYEMYKVDKYIVAS